MITAAPPASTHLLLWNPVSTQSCTGNQASEISITGVTEMFFNGPWSIPNFILCHFLTCPQAKICPHKNSMHIKFRVAQSIVGVGRTQVPPIRMQSFVSVAIRHMMDGSCTSLVGSHLGKKNGPLPAILAAPKPMVIPCLVCFICLDAPWLLDAPRRRL